MSDPPRLKDIAAALSKLPWSEVKAMSVQLNMELSTLTQIEQQYGTFSDRMLHSMDTWLRSDPEASWARIVAALNTIGETALAATIERQHCHPIVRETSPISLVGQLSSSPSGLMAETTQPQSVPAPHTTATALPDSERVQRVAHEATQLQDQFVRVLTHTEIAFTEKPPGFLFQLQITLTTLPLSNKFKRLCFLETKKQEIEDAKSVSEIFKILRCHWNYGDYALLQRLVQEFGHSAIQSEMGEYVVALERFEKETTIQDFSRAKPGDRDAPYDFSRAVLQLNKDPSKCTLYEVRQLVESLATSMCLDQYVMFLSGHSIGSVIIKLAFPRVVLDLIISALNKAFWETHQIVSVTIDKKPVEEYSEEHVKVHVCYRLHVAMYTSLALWEGPGYKAS